MHFYQFKKKDKTSYSIMKNKNTKEASMDGLKSIGKKVGSAVFVSTTRRGNLPEQAKMTGGEKTRKGNIYRFSELYTIHQILERKPP